VAAHPLTPTLDGFYIFVPTPGSHTVCEALQAGWQQTAPLAVPPTAGETLANCAPFGAANGLTLGPRGYNYAIIANEPTFQDLNFGNIQASEALQLGSIQGIKFNDRNRNGVHDVGEQTVPNWKVHVFGTTSIGGAIHLVTFTGRTDDDDSRDDDGPDQTSIAARRRTPDARDALDGSFRYSSSTPSAGVGGIAAAACRRRLPRCSRTRSRMATGTSAHRTAFVHSSSSCSSLDRRRIAPSLLVFRHGLGRDSCWRRSRWQCTEQLDQRFQGHHGDVRLVDEHQARAVFA
jgi:hypothetical protein